MTRVWYMEIQVNACGAWLTGPNAQDYEKYMQLYNKEWCVNCENVKSEATSSYMNVFAKIVCTLIHTEKKI